jgi:RHS repeat-associated protein
LQRSPNTGRESDAKTGLYYYRARYYDSTTGRFASEDPIRFLGGVDFYEYVDNDSIDLVDPFGLLPKPKVPFRWRRCTTSETAFCIQQCAEQAKRFESCRVSQTLRIKNLKHGPDWYDYVGDPSCSCEDPEDNWCKELQREPLKRKLENILNKVDLM